MQRIHPDAGHLADLIIDLIFTHTDEDTSPETIFAALKIVHHDISVEFEGGDLQPMDGVQL